MFALKRSEVRQLLTGVNLRSTWGKRDYLMILFLFHTGLRIGELCQLTVDMVAFEGQPRDELFLAGALTKTRSARVVPFNPVAQKCVAKLLEFNRSRGFSTVPAAPLFPWKKHQYLPPREAQRTIQKLREKVGMTGKVTPHTLRHTFASELVRNRVSLPTVKDLLGHRYLSSTQIYTHTTEDEKRSGVFTLAQV